MRRRLPKNKKRRQKKWCQSVDSLKQQVQDIRSRRQKKRASVNKKRPTETPGMVLNSVRIKASKYFSGMYSKAAASGRFIRRYFLHYLWIGILAVLDHIGRLAEDLAALPWEEMAEKVFFLPYRVLQQGKASGKKGEGREEG